MDRRSFIGTFAGGLVAAHCGRAPAQPPRVRRIGWLRAGAIPVDRIFWDDMREYGWTEGVNLVVESRYAETTRELALRAVELAQLGVDVLMTDGTPATQAAKAATTTIPIVFALAADPVASGLVASLARPGGNLTGVALGEFEEKKLEILKQGLPAITRVAFPAGIADPAITGVAADLGIELHAFTTRAPADLPGFFASARKVRAQAVVFPNHAWTGTVASSFAAEAMKLRLPSIGTWRYYAQRGGLMAYGPTSGEYWHRKAIQVDKILKGARPAELPVERPSSLYLALNLRTAHALGVSIQPSVVLRADELVE
jgi:putative ABC transport system substrate-binding protein